MTTLYRLYGPDGVLLYVGVADHWPSRMKQHSREKEWWHEVANTSLQQFPTRERALAAERSAIAMERPRYNIVHRGSVPEAPRARFVRFHCDHCGWLIDPPSQGFLHIATDEMRRVDREWHRHLEVHPPKPQSSWSPIDVAEVMARPKPAKWEITCKTCDPHGDRVAYWLSLNQMKTVDELLHGIEHLLGKPWVLERTDFRSLLRRLGRGNR